MDPLQVRKDTAPSQFSFLSHQHQFPLWGWSGGGVQPTSDLQQERGRSQRAWGGWALKGVQLDRKHQRELPREPFSKAKASDPRGANG